MPVGEDRLQAQIMAYQWVQARIQDKTSFEVLSF
jgi:hypothetical protein